MRSIDIAQQTLLLSLADDKTGARSMNALAGDYSKRGVQNVDFQYACVGLLTSRLAEPVDVQANFFNAQSMMRLTVAGERLVDNVRGRDFQDVERKGATEMLAQLAAGKTSPKVEGIGPARHLALIDVLKFDELVEEARVPVQQGYFTVIHPVLKITPKGQQVLSQNQARPLPV